MSDHPAVQKHHYNLCDISRETKPAQQTQIGQTRASRPNAQWAQHFHPWISSWSVYLPLLLFRPFENTEVNSIFVIRAVKIMIIMWWVEGRLSELNDCRPPCFLIFTHITTSDHFRSDLSFTVQYFKANANSSNNVTKPPPGLTSKTGCRVQMLRVVLSSPSLNTPPPQHSIFGGLSNHTFLIFLLAAA